MSEKLPFAGCSLAAADVGADRAGTAGREVAAAVALCVAVLV